jgi:glycosyltransferase involved in cell wall biosynthesis
MTAAAVSGHAAESTETRPERPLTVLHIIPTLGVGGTERQLVKLLPRMDRSRFRQALCFYTRSETLEGLLHAAGIPTIFLDKFAMPGWSFFRRLRRAIREVRPDIVHTWLYSANVWGRLAAVSCGVRTIVASDRGMADAAPAHLILFERLLAGRTVRTANSRAAAASLSGRYGLALDGIRVIVNAVDEVPEAPEDSRRALRRSLGLPEEGRLVLMVARQSVEKNHPMYFRVAAQVGRRRPDVTFVALGHQFRPAALREALARSGAERFVRLVDQKEDVPRWLGAADVFCLTSNHEGLPNVVLEAMAAGVPVVCTDFASAREIVTDDEVGIVVGRDDDAAMTDAVLALLEDEGRRRRMAAAGRRHVRECFGWDRLVREMETLYESAARRDGTAR